MVPGYDALVVTLVAWLTLAFNLGVASAVIERISGGEDPSTQAV